MIDHDRLFKELLTIFLDEFLELFLPELAQHIERDSVEFLDKEMFTELALGDRREADLIVKARIDGENSFFLIHLEHQAQQEPDFSRRMFRYFSILYERYDLPIYPIALFSFQRPLVPEPSTHLVKCHDLDTLTFNFRVIQLNQMSWRDYIQKPNPVAAALMCRMRIDPTERHQVKLACLRLLTNLGLDKARGMLVSNFVDQYLRLDSQEEQHYAAEFATIDTEEQEAMIEMTNTWIEKGLEQGRAAERIEIAKRLIAAGLSVQAISEATGLTLEEVLDLR